MSPSTMTSTATVVSISMSVNARCLRRDDDVIAVGADAQMNVRIAAGRKVQDRVPVLVAAVSEDVQDRTPLDVEPPDLHVRPELLAAVDSAHAWPVEPVVRVENGPVGRGIGGRLR